MEPQVHMVTPDPKRLAAARSVAKSYFDRKRRWTRALFVIAALAEVGFFGAMLTMFDFSNRFYWFLFFGLTFIYSPLITFIVRNSVMLEKFYYRLLLELKYGKEVPDEHPNHHEGDDTGQDEASSFLVQKTWWAKFLFYVASAMEAGFGITMLYFMDFSSQIYWFLLFGFLGVYSPLILSAWRNTFAIDRTYYALIDELKYGGTGSVKAG